MPLSVLSGSSGNLVERRQGPLASLPCHGPKYDAADYFKLLVGKGIAGQGI
jgi:hypothetical protein